MQGQMTQPREKIRGKHPVTDPYYRYEMEQLMVVSMKGRTCLPNLGIVVKHLHRPAAHILKWFSTHLNCGVIQPEELQGFHSQLAVREALYAYIQGYVLCPKCQLPETHLLVGPVGHLTHKCQSCGKQMPSPQSRYAEWLSLIHI